MASIRLVGFAVVTAATLAALGACGSDDATAPGALDGGGDDGQSGDGGPLADGYVPPVRAEFGLDTRPANPTCKAPARPPTTANVKWEQVFANVALAQPMMMAQIPGDKTRWFVAQRSGEIVSFPAMNPPNTPTPPTLVGTVQGASGLPLNTNGEGGLLGFAIHPKFAQNGKIFVTWTTTGGGPVDMLSRVGVLHSPDNGVSFDSYKDVLGPFAQPFTNHDGGGIAFGTDGLLYLSFGDGGDANDTNNAGQDRTRFFSKVLRIDVDNVPAGKTYGIPADNPFANGGGEPATFAMGFRNPFRFSIDRATNEVWVGDVGQGLYEEIDAKVKLGGNYGWPSVRSAPRRPASSTPSSSRCTREVDPSPAASCIAARPSPISSARTCSATTSRRRCGRSASIPAPAPPCRRSSPMRQPPTGSRSTRTTTAKCTL
jgi:glucose/arabinose dehydrogenase